MDRPVCPRHPDGRVWRDGRYGQKGRRQRWRCIPMDGSKSHLFTPTLPLRGAGGDTEVCLECARPWNPWEGMPTGEDDRFSIQEKALTLVELARGATYREASRHIRDHVGFVKPGSGGRQDVSRDGRLAMDWVPHYAQILGDAYLPTAWPEVLVLDHVPFHVKAKTPEGLPKRAGRPAFHVLGALSYGNGSVIAAQQASRRPLLWRVAADTKVGEVNWRRFLKALPGQPSYVVCDQQKGLVNAVRRLWPDTKVYPCAHHLQKNAEAYLAKAGLRLGTVADALHGRTFVEADAYHRFLRELAALREPAEWAKLSETQWEAVADLESWVAQRDQAIRTSLNEPHAPLTTGGLEKPLRANIKNALYDRRALFRNLDRLDALLILLQLNQNGLANVQRWAETLRGEHLHHHGRVPGRRRVDTTRRRIRPVRHARI
jgi:hypothetical protein